MTRALIAILVFSTVLLAGFLRPASAQIDLLDTLLHKEMRPLEVIEPRPVPESTKSRNVFPEHTHARRYFPTAGYDKYYGDDRVFEASPIDNAVFRMGSIVTLIWHKMLIHTNLGGYLDHYYVLIQSDLGYYEKFWVKVSEDETYINFRPPAPAHYTWQVRGHMSDGGITASMGRTFQVLP